jgi:hypothetical protein
MTFYKNKILAIMMISTIIGCKNSTKEANPEKNRTEKTDTQDNSNIQIESGDFNKSLSLQNFSFDVSTKGEGSIQQLDIQPHGLKIDNKKITQEIAGRVTNAEIEDLNSDGFPEILIYITSAGSGSYGNVIGYSANNGKSLSQIYFPPITDNQEANKGYMGHDEFLIADKVLIRRFKTYNTKDVNSNPTGKIREIQYKLADGESSRKFVVDKIIEYPIK